MLRNNSILPVLLAIFLANSIPADSLLATFQNGVNGYNSVRSVNISTLNAEAYNGYNGTTFTDAVDWCIGDLPAQSYNISPLMRFENLNIPAGSTVVSATLTCTFGSYTNGQRVTGHYLNVDWTDTVGPNSGDGVGWARRNNGLPWNTPGARGAGSDVIAGKSFAFPPMNDSGWQVRSVALDPGVVQNWLDNPAANHGIALSVDQLDHHTGFRQPQNSAVADRPVLSITYSTAVVTPAAASAWALY